MTIDEIRAYESEYLTPAQIAPILGVDAHDIRVAARENPERLGFNVSVIGTRTKIPRRAFLKWLGANE